MSSITPAIMERFNLVLHAESDINQHLATMRSIALGCRTITEFGVRSAVSTCAWLASGAEVIRCYDLDIPGNLGELEALAKDAGIDFQFIQQDTTKVFIEPTDLLFIDTKHCGAQATQELTNNAERVSKYLIFHDTDIYGWHGDDGKQGLNYAIYGLMLRTYAWRLVYHSPVSFGLTILKRV